MSQTVAIGSLCLDQALTLLLAKFLSINLCVIKIILAIHHDGFLRFFVINLLLELARDAHPQRIRLNHRALGDHGSGSDNTAFADLGIVQNYAAHANEAAIANGAAVQRDRVPHGYPIAQGDAVSVPHAMEHAAILHVGVLADADGKDIAPDHGVHPDAGIFADLNVADDLRGLIDIA